MNTIEQFREKVQKDMYELSKLSYVPVKAFKILRETDLKDYDHMKVSEVTDLIIQLANINPDNDNPATRAQIECR